MSAIKLTPAHLTAMYAVRTGANVWDELVAHYLREVKEYDPELIDIYSPTQLKRDIGCTDEDIYQNGQRCFFGAILTQKGKEKLQSLTAQLARNSLQGNAHPVLEEKEIIQSAMQDDLDDPAFQISQ